MVTANGTLTESQQARRTRMLQAAEELAVQGGWDGVQMREVAQRAEVALGTLYRYFPSKEHLLVSVMLDEVGQLADRLSVRPPRGDDPVERVNDVLRRANRALRTVSECNQALARATELIASVPGRHTRGLQEGMHAFALPVSTPDFTVSLLWHPRLEADAAHRWLRGLVREVCAEG